MRKSQLTALALLAASLGSTMAAPPQPREGSEYIRLEPAVTTTSSPGTEVIEFFSYSCSHCRSFDAPLNDWEHGHPAGPRLKRVPVIFSEARDAPAVRMHYALESIGELKRLHTAIFDEIQVNHRALLSDSDVLRFVRAHGVDETRFKEAWDSPAVAAQMQAARKLAADYHADGVPLLAVVGRYETALGLLAGSLPKDHRSQSEASLQQATLRVLDWLVAKADQAPIASALSR